MRLEKIITLASEGVRLRFIAMERSLRAVGCDLPLWVIPYDDNRFELPKGAHWWEVPEVIDWVSAQRIHPMMRKCQCFLTSAYQYVDSDIVFLRNPEKVLQDVDGFVTCCCHWHDPSETITPESRAFLGEQSTTWQKEVFNAGQWACDRQLFDFEQLERRTEEPRFRSACLEFSRISDQPALNLLVNSTGVPIRNLTLPPFRLQSAWAGDYGEDYRSYWKSEQETPYLIHWAGVLMDKPRAINELIYQYFSPTERLEWDAYVQSVVGRIGRQQRSLRTRLRKLRRATAAFLRELSN